MKSIIEISETNPFRCQIDDSPFNEASYTSFGLMETTIRDLIRCGEDINEYEPIGCAEFVNKFNILKRELNYADK